MTSKSPSQSFKDIESDADALMDELFRDVEESFSAQAAFPEPKGEPVTRKQPERSRSMAVPWGIFALGGLAVLSGTVLWWSYVHLPKRLALLSGQSTDNSSLVAGSDVPGENGTNAPARAEGDSGEQPIASAADEASNPTTIVSDAVGNVVQDAVETTATTASNGVTASSTSPNDSAISDIEVDQAEVDRILAATAPPPIPAPPPPPVAYAPPPPPTAPPPAPDMTLVGVMDGSNGDAVALLMVGNAMRQVAVGEAITGGWRVASISDRSVSVTNGAQSRVLGL